MIEYIKQYVALVRSTNTRTTANAKGSGERRPIASGAAAAAAIFAELQRLDPLDFEPEVQMKFLQTRANISYYATATSFLLGYFHDELKDLLPILDKYRGAGNHRLNRNFAYVRDSARRKIVERDYAELTLRLFPGGAWKSTVILAGSILEAVLFDVLTDPKRLAAVEAAGSADADVGRKCSILKGKWDLADVIKIAAATGVAILPKDREESIDRVLRNYRNFIHPEREIKDGYEIGEPEAGLAKYALEAVCNHLESNL